jgi:hypothetical protein
MTAGSHDDYEWLVCDRELHWLVEQCPEVVLSKYLAITSFDSGPLCLNEDEENAGWVSEGGIAYSPRINDANDLTHDMYDEWYVFCERKTLGDLAPPGRNIFDEPLRKGRVEVFVNFGGYHLDRADMEPLADLFWKQLAWIEPESYLAEGEQLICVSSNRKLFAKVKERVSEFEDAEG